MSVHIAYFVHGTTTDNEQKIATGWLPGELSARGREQAIELGEIVKTQFDVMISSDLKRAVESAELGFAGRFPLLQDVRLRECNYGEFDGTDRRGFVKTDYIEQPCPGGESYCDVETRMRDFVEDLKNITTVSTSHL